MGAFFTNVQVFVGNISLETAQAQLISTIKEFICADDFVETLSPEEADRSVIIVNSKNGRWIAVFDEATENQDTHSLMELAIISSKVAGKVTVAIQVHDSDICELYLCRNGEQVDAFNNELDYWGSPVSDEEREEFAGKPKLWQDLLVDGKTPADLRAAWDSEPLMAEDIIHEMSPLLAMDSSLATDGYRYFSEEIEYVGKERFDEYFEAYSISRLIFRSTDRDNEKSPQYALPKLALASLTTELKFRLDQPSSISVAMNNQGGHLKGLKIYTWGDAIDNDLVRLGDVQIKMFTSKNSSSRDIKAYHQEWSKEQKNDLKLNVAEIVDFECPATAFNKNDFDALSRFYIDAALTPLKLGRGEISLVAVPMENPKDGQMGFKCDIQIESPLDISNKPLKADPIYDYQKQTIQKLKNPKFLLAMVSMNLDRKTAYPIALAAIASWHQVVAKYAGNEYISHYSVGVDKKLKKLKLLTKDIPSGKSWQTLCDQIEVCDAFNGDSPESAEINNANCGFGFGASKRFFQYRTDDNQYIDVENDTVAPHLALWVKVEGCNVIETNYLTEQLTKIIDKVVTETDAWQAFLAKWDWQPIGLSLANTLYEQSCALHGQITTGRNWCKRFLRAASEQIWLSQELRKHLEDEAELAEICQLEEIGQTLRLSLKPEINLNRLEEVLKPLLASEQDWLEARQNRPHRKPQSDQPTKD